ncbi:MAG: MgtC/SapB family protein [Candidatus Promineifilaceae bacterium]|nr:MgtC/SapB family protein [Anaerolineaceae bacterium]
MMLQWQLLGKMVLAMVLGGVLGYERETADKPAGLRTHMLVAGASALLTGLGEVLVPQLGIAESLIRADPIRMIEAVITGITFLGTGTIIRQRGKNQVEGLTTAASLLMAGALGIGVALNQFLLAIGAAVIVLLILRVVKEV